MNFKQAVQISMVTLGLVSPAISPHLLAGETGFETETEVVTTTTEVSRPVVNGGGSDVGISSRDGITYSAPDVLITRNGVTERVTVPILLPNGTRVNPNGTVTLAGGSRIQLRTDQILSLGGKLLEAPITIAVMENTDAIIDVSRTAVVTPVPAVTRARPAARRLRTGAPAAAPTQATIVSPASTTDDTQVIQPTLTPHFVDPEIEYILGQ